MSIWESRELRKNINEEHQISLNEGNTPLQKFATSETNDLFLKREDLNPTGSWKDRGTAYKIAKLATENVTECVIASSGNAAISLLTYANIERRLKVNVVVSPNVNASKLSILEDLAKIGNHEIVKDEHAKRKSSQIAAQKGIHLLKSSIDEDSLKGYWTLGFELADFVRTNSQKETIIFAAVSSGTAVTGMVEGLFYKLEKEHLMPKIIMCQTQSCRPLVEDVQSTEEKSLADAIVDQSLLRKPQLKKILDQTNGQALAITNDELEDAKKFAKDSNVEDLSYTSLLPVAGYLRLQSQLTNSNIILITSGR